MFSVRRSERGELSLLVAVFLLSLFGVVMVYSASNYVAKVEYGDEYYFFKKQILGFVLGSVCMFAVAFFDYRKFNAKKPLKWIFLLFPCLLLALVFVPGVGKTNYGATRWIGIGPITVQPSELAKYGFVLFASAWIAEHPQKVKTFRGILPILGAGILVCALIIAEPNMSVTMCVGMVMLAMIFMSGTKIKNFIFILLPFFALVPALIIAEPYRLKRLIAFIDPWSSPKDEGYQLIQSLYALGNGGWFGVGLFHSRQKYRFLPFAESDFILSVIGEEFGYIGVLALFAVSIFIIYKGIRIASRCDDLFGCMLAVGITLVYGIQTAVNALVVSGTIPPTGLPLPFISSGNTSLIISMTSMGILYNISRHNKKRFFI